MVFFISAALPNTRLNLALGAYPEKPLNICMVFLFDPIRALSGCMLSKTR